MFRTIAELVSQAESRSIKIHELMIEQEMAWSGHSRAKVIAAMQTRFAVMKQSVQTGITGVISQSGMTGMDASKVDTYLKSSHTLSGSTVLLAARNAIAINEVNAAMGVVCAMPTAGSSGVLPAVMLAAQKNLGMDDETIIRHLFTAGAIGQVIANNACISGAAGGCQAEIGSASAMAAATVTELAGGTPTQAAHAMALALKNMLGLTCDPLAGLVEVPCIKRNAAGSTNALLAADLALAGVESKIPWDEVISAMYQIGQAMNVGLRETAIAGLAATETGKAWKKKFWQE